MSDRDENQPPAASRPVGGPVLYILAAAFAAIAGFASITIGDFFQRQSAPAEQATTTQNTGGNLAAASTEDGKGGLTKLVYADGPKPLAEDIGFTDDAGQRRGLADWKGKVVLLNLWATWCAPCKLEMPSLSRLQTQLGGADFAVVPVSLDRNGPDAPRKFLSSNNLGNLPLLMDAGGDLTTKLGVIGLPATLILDREGREVARLLGPAEWDGPAALDVLRAAIAGKSKP
jgi:thiol-disulfide isomerase/thioredoxin